MNNMSRFGTHTTIPLEERKQRFIQALRTEFDYDPSNEEKFKTAMNMLAELEEHEVRIDKKTEETIVNLVEGSIVDNPAFQKILEDFGVPRTVIFDRNATFPEDDNEEFSAPGYTDSAIIYLDGKTFDKYLMPDGTYEPKEEVLPREKTGWAEDQNAAEVFRHEVGHVIENRTMGLGTIEQIAALRQIQKKYEELVIGAKNLQTSLGIMEKNEGRDAVIEFLKTHQNNPAVIQLIDAWWTPYAETNQQEWVAELFTMSTSPNQDIRKLVPEDMRELVTKWLGFSPWKEFENA